MMHLLRKYDVAPVGRNDAMFAPMCRQAHIIRRSRHHWRSQHHLPKANIIQKTHLCLGRQKCVFCCLRAVKRCVNVGKNSKKVCDFVLLTTRQIGIYCFVLLKHLINVTIPYPTITPMVFKIKSSISVALTLNGN